MPLMSSAWPKHQHDLFNSGRSPYISNADGTLKWVYSLVNSGNIAIDSDGVIYTTSGLSLYAINPDGTLKWIFSNTDLVALITTPAIASDGTLYVGSSYKTGVWDSYVYAINPNGTLKWRSLSVGNVINSSPTIDNNGDIYFGSADGRFRAYHPDGTAKFNIFISNGISSSPAIDSGGVIYFAADFSGLRAWFLDGTQKWHYNNGTVGKSVAITNDTIYFGTAQQWPQNDRTIYALDYDGNYKWEYFVGENLSVTPAIALDGTIYVPGQSGTLVALNPDGSLKWTFVTLGGLSSPIIDADGIIYIGSGDNTFYAINPDGTLKWSHAFSSGVSSPAIDSNGVIYVGSTDLHAFESGAVENILGRTLSRGTGASVSGGIACGRGKKR